MFITSPFCKILSLSYILIISHLVLYVNIFS
nr:MAG TPA: hypothetical protein [Caudoviricetes sp.]